MVEGNNARLRSSMSSHRDVTSSSNAWFSIVRHRHWHCERWDFYLLISFLNNWSYMCNKFQQVICICTESNKTGPSEQLFSMTFIQMVSMCNMIRPLQMLHGNSKRQTKDNFPSMSNNPLRTFLKLYICYLPIWIQQQFWKFSISMYGLVNTYQMSSNRLL